MSLQDLYLIALAATGAVMCFFGFRTFKAVLVAYGIQVGGFAAGTAVFHLTQNTPAAVVSGVVGAILGGVVTALMYLVGVFAIGAATAGLVGAAVTLGGARRAPARIVVSALAVIGGLLALRTHRLVIIVITALSGAALVIGGAWLVCANVGLANAWTLRHTLAGRTTEAGSVYRYLLIGAWFALAAIGAWIQFTATGKPGERPPEEEEESPPPRPWTPQQPTTDC